MAIASIASSFKQSGGYLNSLTSDSFDCGTGSNRALVVIAAIPNTTTKTYITGATAGGNAMTGLTEYGIFDGTLDNYRVFYTLSPPSGSSTVTVSLGSTSYYSCLGCLSLSGVASVRGDNFINYAGNGTSFSQAITSAVDDFILAPMFWGDPGNTLTPTSPATEVAGNSIFATRRISFLGRAGASGTPTLAATFAPASVGFGSTVMSLVAASGGSGGNRLLLGVG